MRKEVKKKIIAIMLMCIMICGTVMAVNAQELSDKAAVVVDKACYGVVRIIQVGNGYVGTGSGFGVGKVGEETDIFVTNRHVVEDQDGNISDEIYILMSNDAVIRKPSFSLDYSKMVKCEVLATTDGYPDYAIVRAAEPIKGRVALPLMSSELLQRSDSVYALGFPASSDDANGDNYTEGNYYYSRVEDVTVTRGIASRFTTIAWADDTKVIQHDAHINHGNSGGPLITSDGAVVGINTYGFGDMEMEHSASVCIDYAMEALDKLGIYYEVSNGNGGGTGEIGAFLKENLRVILIAAGGILVAVVVLVMMKKKQSEQNQVQGSSNNAAPVGQDSGLRLQGVSGHFANRRFAVSGTIRIGRDPARNDLVMPSSTKGVSGAHCILILHNGQIYLKDLGSTYGTYVNGTKVTANQNVHLHAGDRFYLGTEQESFTIIKKQ